MPFITDEDLGAKPKPKLSSKIQFVSDEDLAEPVAPSPVSGQVALPEQTYFSDIIPQYRQEISEAQQRFTKPESNIVDKILGTFQYAALPISTLSRPLLGEPTQRGLQAAGVPENIAKYGGLGSELLIPTGPFAIAKTAQTTKLKAAAEGLKAAYGVNLPDPASLSKLQIQNKNLTAWEKFIGPKFDTVSDKIGGFLQRFGLADNLTKQQQTIKQFRIKKRQLKGEISDRFITLKNRIQELPLEEQRLFEKSFSLDVPTGNQNIDSLILDIRNAIDESVQGVQVQKKVSPELPIPSEEAPVNILLNLAEEAPGLLGARGITKIIEADELDLYKEYGFILSPGNKPGSKQIRVNRKFTGDELGQLTELDTGANYIANIGRSLANDVSAFQFYDDIFKHFINSGLVEKTPGYRKVSSRKIRGTDLFQKGTLAGQYIPEDLADDLEYIDDIRSSYANVPGIKQYIKANQAWKILKTAWNPKVHFGNFFSSAINFDLVDARKRTLITAMKELKNKKSMYRLAEQQGVFKSGFIRTELEGLSKDALEIFIATIQSEKDLNNNNIINTGIKIANKFKDLAINTNSKLLDLYNIEDDIFKFAIFIDRIEKGYKPIDAATDARVLGIDYDVQAPVINILRDTTHPFISYPYRIIPRLTEAAVKHPIKFGKWAVLGYGLQQALTDYEQGAIELLPERQNQTVFGIPGAPSTLVKVGKNKVVNVQRGIPGGNVFDVPDTGIPLLPQSLQPSGGLAGSVARSFVQGQDQFGEKLLESPTSQLSRLGTRAESFLESNVPNIPGVPYAPSTRQLKQAISGQYSPYQDPKTIAEAALGTIGIDIINLDKSRLIKTQEKILKNNLDMIGKMENKLKVDFEKDLISQDNYAIEQLKLTNEKILLNAMFRDKIK